MSEKICTNGHTFEKTSDCPTCPICAKDELITAYKTGFPKIGSPAYFALKDKGIALSDLPKFTEKQLLQIHGIGPKAVRILRAYLQDNGQAFAEK